MTNDAKENLKENAPWLHHYSQAIDSLENRTNGDNTKIDQTSTEDSEKTDSATHVNGNGGISWRRPSSDLDRLYMSVGNGDVIEVGHPASRNEDEDPR